MYYVDESGTVREVEEREGVLVRSESDLEILSEHFGEGIYMPGLIAYTAGGKDMWHLNADGEWIRFVGGED